ncbi:hypothetical protein [Hyphomonas sp.]|uniref:hypothetical protein n=1 Tax=Hyphomonas sp. TaxID=87 RepID=UPI0030FB67E1
MSNLDDLPEFLKPTIKLFLSVDLVGSTKLKHDEDVLNGNSATTESLDGIGARWFRYLIDFYSGFEEMFTEEWKKAFSEDGIAKPHWIVGDTPSLWKVNGDELIYVLTISHPGQIVAALYSWREALLRYRSHLHERNASLDVKATAWMAGFPIGNHEVAFSRNLSNVEPGSPEHAGKFGQYYRLNEWYKSKGDGGNSDYVKDYIGPAVDTGFRIAGFASSRRFPVSVEVAFFLANFAYDAEVHDKIALRYHGRESMKGVLSGIPYPIFWIDAASPDDELIKAEDKLRSPDAECDLRDVKQYVKVFFEDAKNKLFEPFIFGCDDKVFCTIPKNYALLLKQTADIWAKELAKIEILNQPAPPVDGVAEEEVHDDEMETLVGKVLKGGPSRTSGG